MPDATRGVERAASLAPLVRRCADESERERCLAPAVVDAFHEAGLFRIQVPERFGGAGLDPIEALPVYEEVAAADGSAGWNLAIGAGVGRSSRCSRTRMRSKRSSGARALVAGSVNPMALRITPEADGYRVSGRLRYASGVSQSNWLMAGGLLFDGAGPRPRLAADGAPEIVGAFFPTREARVLDTWRVNGLAGTGSHDVEVDDVFAPAARCFDFRSTKPRPFDRLAALPLFSRLGPALAGVGIGIARRAIEERVVLVALGLRHRRGGLRARGRSGAQRRRHERHPARQPARAVLARCACRDATRRDFALAPGAARPDHARARSGSRTDLSGSAL